MSQENVPALDALRKEAAAALRCAIALTIDDNGQAELANVQAVTAIATYTSACLIDQQRIDAEASLSHLTWKVKEERDA